jgi:catechol 2,3-dioxygenase-like lactoylglutathione lyase family enzyme
MINAVSHLGLWVHDQDEAKAFYTEKLGFEVRQDATLDELGGYRWLTVGPPGQPNLNVILSVPTPPAVDDESAEQLKALIAKGALGPGILQTEDCRKEIKELEGKGVEVTQQPDERFYGIDAAIRDPSGNEWRVVQPIEFDLDAMQKAQANGG